MDLSERSLGELYPNILPCISNHAWVLIALLFLVSQTVFKAPHHCPPLPCLFVLITLPGFVGLPGSNTRRYQNMEGGVSWVVSTAGGKLVGGMFWHVFVCILVLEAWVRQLKLAFKLLAHQALANLVCSVNMPPAAPLKTSLLLLEESPWNCPKAQLTSFYWEEGVRGSL